MSERVSSAPCFLIVVLLILISASPQLHPARPHLLLLSGLEYGEMRVVHNFIRYLDGLGDAVEQGLVNAVGVSNYSGALTGKYTPENPPTGPRRQIYTPEFLSKLQSLLNRIKEIGEKYSKTNTQVVLNWLIAQDNVVPILGAKNAEQAAEFAGALGWRLNSEEVGELRALATEIKPVTGFPVEKL